MAVGYTTSANCPTSRARVRGGVVAFDVVSSNPVNGVCGVGTTLRAAAKSDDQGCGSAADFVISVRFSQQNSRRNVLQHKI
jgi:hypothetical protein